jgi:hypothetical protein
VRILEVGNTLLSPPVLTSVMGLSPSQHAFQIEPLSDSIALHLRGKRGFLEVKQTECL